jgi:hypothetical protein
MLAVIATHEDQAMAGVEGEAFDDGKAPPHRRSRRAAGPEAPQCPGAECDQPKNKDEREREFEKG